MGTDAFEPGCSFQHRQPVFSRLMAIGYWLLAIGSAQIASALHPIKSH